MIEANNIGREKEGLKTAKQFALLFGFIAIFFLLLGLLMLPALFTLTPNVFRIVDITFFLLCAISIGTTVYFIKEHLAERRINDRD